MPNACTVTRFITILGSSTMLAGAAIAAPVDQGAPAGAPPQTRTTESIGDIVVTARRREESLQSVPLAITAFSDDKLKQQAIYSSNDLNKAVPGLTVAASSGSPGLPTFAIRGRGQNYGAAAGSVETYFADVPLSGPFQAPTLAPQFFDIQSFQVLKGPQGTLFGRSTTGGAVLIVPRAPDDSFGGYVRLQAGTRNNLQTEAAINLPLGDIAALRVAGFIWQRDGYGRTYAGSKETLTGATLPAQDYNTRNQKFIRATLRLQPGDNFVNTTVLTYQHIADQYSAGAGLLLAPSATGFGSRPAPGYGTRRSFSDVRFDNPPRTAVALINTSTLDLGDTLTIKNIFGYIHAKGSPSQATNADGTAADTVSLPRVPYRGTSNQYTNEFQIQGSLLDERLDFILGGLIDKTRQPRGTSAIPYASGTIRGPSCPTPASCTVAVSARFAATNFDSYGLFGSATFDLTPQLSLTAAYRHSWDKVNNLSGSASAVIPQAPGAQLPLVPTSLVLNQKRFQGDTFNVGIDYHITPDILAYGGFRRGYKRGGFNDSAVPPLPKNFGPESIDDYFLGLKSSFDLGGIRTRFNIEGYYDNYKGQQVSYLGIAFISGVPNLIAVSTNVDKTRYQGLEIDLQSDLARWLTVEGNYAFTDASNRKWVDNTVAGMTQDLSHNPVPYISKHKFSATARLHGDLGGGNGELALAPTVNYQDSFVTYVTGLTLPYATQYTLGLLFAGANVPINIPGLTAGANRVPRYATVDLRAEWNNVLGSGLDLAANVTNLTNKTYFEGSSATFIFGVDAFAYGPPRMITFDLKAKF